MKKKVLYTGSKYITFVLKFIQALYIAKFLGPSGFAIYGFAQLIALYVSFMHFGIPFSVHALLSTAKNEDRQKTETYINDGLTFLLISGLIYCFIIGGVIFSMPHMFEKFQFERYGLLSVIIGLNLIVVQYFSNIYQVFGQFIRIALNELVSVIVLFCIVFIYKEDSESLLYYLLVTSALMFVLNAVFFLYKPPFKLRFSLRKAVLKKLLKIGLPMLLASVGFYLITISVRSISSYQYSLEEIGLLTFALNISNSIMMGLNAISWTFYSTILSNTCGETGEAHAYIKKVNRIYNFGLSITIFIGILVFPLLYFFLPAYESFNNGIIILLLSQIFMSISFGYSSLLVAQNKQNKMALVSFITLAFVVTLSVLVCYLQLPFVFQTLVIAVGMLLYSVLISYLGAKVCNQTFIKVFFIELLSHKIIIPVLIIIAMLFFNGSILFSVLALLVYLILSRKDVLYMLDIVKQLKKTKT